MSLRRVSAPLLIACAVALLAPGAAAQPVGEFRESAADWAEAAGLLGAAGALAAPAVTAGLPLAGRISVVADGLAFGPAVSGDTAASATYRSGKRRLDIMQKWANTGWAAEPAIGWQSAKVGTIRIRGAAATVFANCWTDRDRPAHSSFRCSRADVLRTGGMLRTTVRSGSLATSVLIQTEGLTYAELLGVARGLGSTGAGEGAAGSAQMLAMCQQMVNGRMTLQSAGAFAQPLGYQVRAGSIDGVPQAVTMDYRWNRFTVSLVSGAVTSCTYG